MQLVLCLMVASITEVIVEGIDTTSNVTKFIALRVTSLFIALVPSACLPSLASKCLRLFCSVFGEVTGATAPSVCLLLTLLNFYREARRFFQTHLYWVLHKLFFFGWLISGTDKCTFWPHYSSFPYTEPSLDEQLWFQRPLHSFLFLLASCENYSSHIFSPLIPSSCLPSSSSSSFVLPSSSRINKYHKYTPKSPNLLIEYYSTAHWNPSQSSASALRLSQATDALTQGPWGCTSFSAFVSVSHSSCFSSEKNYMTAGFVHVKSWD